MHGGNKAHVLVLMGGMSSEHDVSLRSGAKVVAHLDPDRYEVTPVLIDRGGAWRFGQEETALPFGEAIARLYRTHVDCVFLALHGPFGEDGRLQGLLDLLRLPYTGSGCIASGIAIDKIRSKALVRSEGVRVAKEQIITETRWSNESDRVLNVVESEIGWPCVMKSPCQGSSLGMAMATTRESFERSMNELLAFDPRILVEEHLKGTEVTCAVLDVAIGHLPRALPVTEIRPVTAAFFDYEAKYTLGATEEITPAPLPDAVTLKVQQEAVRVHQILGCQGLSRSDFILVEDEPIWLEVNTIPGLTETSLFPQAAAAAGIAFPDLMAALVERAMADGPRT